MAKHALSALKKINNTDFEERFGASMWFYGFKWYTTFDHLQKQHSCEKSNSLVVIENTLDQSDCIISKILISQKLFEVEGLLFACNNVSMEAAIWSRRFSRVWS